LTLASVCTLFSICFFFFLLMPRPLRSPLFPYTTLFRSRQARYPDPVNLYTDPPSCNEAPDYFAMLPAFAEYKGPSIHTEDRCCQAQRPGGYQKAAPL